MWGTRAVGSSRAAGLILFLTSISPALFQQLYNSGLLISSLNCTTTDNHVSFYSKNGSRLEDPIFPYRRVLEGNQQNQDNERLNEHFEDKCSDRYPDDQQLDILLDDEDINLQVRPLENPADDQMLNRNHEDHPRDKYANDYERHRNLDNDQFRKHFDAENKNRNFNDPEIYRNFDDRYLNENYDEPKIDRNSEELNKNGEQERNKNLNNKYINKNLDENSNYKHIDEDYDHVNMNKNLNNENINQNNDDRKLNKPIFNDYFDRNVGNNNKDGYFDELHAGSGLNGRNFERHLADQYPDTRIIDRHFQESSVNQQSVKNRDKFQSNKHLIDQNVQRNNDRLNSDRHLDNQHVNRDLDELHLDKHPRQSSYERHLEDNNNDRYFKKTNFDKDLTNPNYERGFIEPNSKKHFDNSQPDHRLDDQNVDRHLVRPQTDKNFDKNIHSDRGLSDDEYNRQRVDQYSNRRYEKQQHEDELEESHSDGFPNNKNFSNYESTSAPRKESNISHLKTFTMPKDWEENKPRLNFPNKTGVGNYKMTTLHLDKGLFFFDFLRHFLSIIQPRNIPLDLLKDTLDGKVGVSKLAAQSVHLEMAFIGVLSFFAVLMFVIPGTECWLCCRRNKYNYQSHPRRAMLCLLTMYAIILGVCATTMLICNEEIASGIDMIPETLEAALQDLREHHAGTAVQLRKCLTRSLDVASEAILADLDNVDDLLGKPMQNQLSSETGVDVALEELMDLANGSQELAYKTDGLLKKAERARELGAELSREADEIRRELERATRDCGPGDRSLCAVLDPSGLHLALRLERVARDDRLLRLRAAGRENLTEAGRQARGEYLYVPHHVDRTTLEARNLIRREVNTARAKVSDEARSIEASGGELSGQLEEARRLAGRLEPYVRDFERARWFVGFGSAMCVLFIWFLLFGALCCRCGCSEGKVRPTLLWFVFLSCLVSMGLWLVIMAALTLASHAEMLLCRPLDDPEYRAVEMILESKMLFGRRLGVPLKELFDKCEQNDVTNSALQMENSDKLEQLTAHWTWSGLSRAFSRLKVDLTGLRILTPNLRERLQNLLYASGPNLTEHRIMIQGPILNKDLNALSDQVENVARQLTDRRMARSFQTIAVQMRDLLSRRVKPLMKMQDDLVYQLATLDFYMQPLQRQVNQSLEQLRNIQYYIDSQGEKIGQMKTKVYIDRMASYLDQWRTHVLIEMNSGISKCRPLWDVLQGIKLLLCNHILGPLNGFWFATLVCVITLFACTPSAHSLASSYWKQPSNKGSVLLPSRQGSPDTVVVERETWRSPM